MERQTILFSGRSGLDHEAMRFASLRIPEVSMRVRAAQKILDREMSKRIDLFGFINSDNQTFLGQPQWKSLSSAVVQLGLFDRYSRQRKVPSLMVGNSNGDSALHVAADILTFEEMIMGSEALKSPSSKIEKVPEKDLLPVPRLTGALLNEYQLLKRGSAGHWKVLVDGSMDLSELVRHLVEESGVHQVINIGPQLTLDHGYLKDRFVMDFDFINSIDLDPMLTWYLRETSASA